MMWHMVEAAVSIFDIHVITTFYYHRLEERVSLQIILLGAAFYALLNYGLIRSDISEVAMVLSSVLLCFATTFLFYATWKQRLFYPIVIVSLGIIAEMISVMMLRVITGLTLNEISAAPFSGEYLAGNITARLLFFIFVRIMYRLHVTNDQPLPLRQWLIIMAVPITSIGVCLGLALSTDGYSMEDHVITPFLILTSMLGINVLSFTLYDELSVQAIALVEHERAKNRMEADVHRYKAMISQGKELAALLHDTRKHNDTLYELLDSGNHSAALSYIERLCSIDAKQNPSTSNAAVLALLRHKIKEAAENAIEVTSNYDADLVLPIDEISLCLILGNALDNAIEACSLLPPEKKRLIEIDIRYRCDRLTLRVANTSNPVKIVNNSCKTTKCNKMLHGYGPLNIQKAVAENGGNSVICYTDGMFILSIIFLL